MHGNAKVNALSQELIQAGLNVKPIRFPTVPKGKERVRICLHSHNTIEQVEKLIQIAQAWIRQDAQEEQQRRRQLAAPAPTISSSSSNSIPSSGPVESPLSMSTLSATSTRPFPAKL